MTSALLVGLALVIAAPAPKKSDEPATGKIEGEWLLESLEGGKQKSPSPGAMRFRFAEGKFTIIDAETEHSANYTIDASKTPIAIDLRPEGNLKELLIEAIVEVKGDTLRLCFGKDKSGRPTEFKANAEKGVKLFVMKRIKGDK